jgi:hypothetical protein
VVRLENKAGYFTLPTQYNDAVALTQAQINYDKSSPDYLTQDLDKVYTYNDPRAYAMSSYSYMIIPTGTNATETKTSTTAQRQTIADFLYYSICQGQAEMGPIGYSPLPLNLVQAGFGQIAKLKQADPGVDLTNRDVTTCNNPTFDPSAHNLSSNRLAKIAPYPATCNKVGQGPCPANVVNKTDPGGTSTGVGGGTGGGGGGGTGATGGTGGNNPSTGSTGSNQSLAPGQSTAPNGAIVGPNGQQTGPNGVTGPSVVINQPILAASTHNKGFSTLLYGLAIALLLGLIVGPVAVGTFIARRHK